MSGPALLGTASAESGEAKGRDESQQSERMPHARLLGGMGNRVHDSALVEDAYLPRTTVPGGAWMCPGREFYGSRPATVQAGQRPGQRCKRPRVKSTSPPTRPRQASLGALARLLGARAIDVGGGLGGIGEDDDLVVPHLGEAARDRDVVLVAADPVHQLADAQRGQERRVAGQHAEVALAAGATTSSTSAATTSRVGVASSSVSRSATASRLARASWPCPQPRRCRPPCRRPARAARRACPRRLP